MHHSNRAKPGHLAGQSSPCYSFYHGIDILFDLYAASRYGPARRHRDILSLKLIVTRWHAAS
jgi:hypothetical protein